MAERVRCPHCEESLNCVICGQDISSADLVAAAERDRYRAAIREAMDIMGSANDRELGEGGVARKAYALLYFEYFAIPAGIARETFNVN
jgi:hypothetical protein